MTYGKLSPTEKIIENALMWLAIAAFALLMVVMAQPAWRGEEMLAEMRANCDKVGGVMLESENFLGTTYKCSPRYDQGVKS